MGLRLLGAQSPYGGGIVVPAVRFDVRAITDAAITSGQATLTSATAGFTSAHVGRKVVVWGAGAAGADLVTTISTFNSATSVTLAANAGTTVSAGVAYTGSDDSTVIQAAIDQLAVNWGGGIVQLPQGTGFASVILKPGVIVQGVGMGNPSAGTNTRGTILQAPPDATQPVIASGGYGANVDPFRSGVRDLCVFGGANVTPGAAVTHGPNVRGIELSSSVADTFVSPVPGSPNDPSPFLERVVVIGVRGDIAVYVGTNQRGAYVHEVLVHRCAGTGLQVACTDSTFTDVQVGVCATGVKVTGSNNLFSNCKSWWHGDPAQASGNGHGWEIRTNYTQLTGCQSQDNFGYGLALFSAGSKAVNNVVTGFVAGGDTSGAVFVQSNGTDQASYNYVEASIVVADRTTTGFGITLDGGGGATIFNNSFVLRTVNPFGLTAGYTNLRLLNSAVANGNGMIVVNSLPGSYFDDGAKASGTYTPNFVLASTRRIQLTGNITVGPVPTSGVGTPVPGMVVTFVIDQDATGSRTITWDASWVGATAPTATANSRTVEKFQNFSTTATPTWARV